MSTWNRRRVRAIRCGIVVAAASAAAALAGCEPAASQPHNAPPPPEVTTVTVRSQDVPVTFEYTGRTAGSREVEVRARVTGIILSRNFAEGGRVEAGQSLFTIDPKPYQATLARVEAELASAEARLEQAKREAARLKPLYLSKAASQKQYDDAVSTEAIAGAEVREARARLTQAKLDLEYTRVESPITGIAGRGLRSEGNYVSGPDVLLTEVTQIDPIYVLFGISDAERLRLHGEAQAGRLVLPENGEYQASVKLADGAVYANSGRVTFSDVHVSKSTGTFEVRAELPNPHGLLRPGQFVRVVLRGAYRPDAVLVPQRAVLEGPEGKFVYVVNGDSKAEARSVAVGDWTGDDWVIIAGLAPGERIIVDGVMKIGPGAPVTVAKPQTDAQSATATHGADSHARTVSN